MHNDNGYEPIKPRSRVSIAIDVVLCIVALVYVIANLP